jgi:hypothetical protein
MLLIGGQTMKKFICVLVSLVLSSCASFDRMNYKEKIILTAGTASVVGYSAATSANKDSENKGAYGTMYGALAGLAVGLIGLCVFDNNDTSADSQRLQGENKALQDKVAEFEKQMGLELLSKGKSESASTPPELKPYFKNGRWESYKLLRWQQDPEDDNVFYKITEQLKLIPKENEE